MTTSSAPDGRAEVHPLLIDAVPGLGEASAPPVVLSHDRAQLDPELVSASQRWRLLIATAQAMAEVGYAATTIERITADAGVSKKTFYKFFSSKEAAFLACYEAIEPALRHIVGGADPGSDLEAIVASLVSAYLAVLAAAPALTQVFLIEALASSERIRGERAEVIARLCQAIEGVLRDAHERDPSVSTLSGPLVLAMVGGINELCVDHLVREDASSLPDLQPDICRFVLRLLGRGGGEANDRRG